MSIISSLIETQEFATLPPVAAKVLKLLENEDLDIRDVARLIETDSSLTLKLLRVANSPLYATRSEISNIQQAIVILGLNRLTNIVLGVSIFSRFLLSSQKNIAELMEKYWWHSSCTGVVAKAVSEKINKSFKENEFIGGLLHDIGKMAMIQYDAAKYLKVIELIDKNQLVDDEAEMALYGITHQEVGYQIAKLWKLPEDLTNIIAFHSHPDESPHSNLLIATVRIADLLCEIWGAGFYEGLQQVNFLEEESWIILSDYTQDSLKLDVEEFTLELEDEFKKSSDFLNLLIKSN